MDFHAKDHQQGEALFLTNVVSFEGGKVKRRRSQQKNAFEKSFPCMLYQMLEDAPKLKFDHIVSWLPAGNGFKVHDRTTFEKDIMGKYFHNQTKYKSFLRQLNLYGFDRTRKGEDKGCLFHENFQRGKLHLCLNMKRDANKDAPQDLSPQQYSTFSYFASQQSHAIDQENKSLIEAKSYANNMPNRYSLPFDHHETDVQRELVVGKNHHGCGNYSKNEDETMVLVGGWEGLHNHNSEVGDGQVFRAAGQDDSIASGQSLMTGHLGIVEGIFDPFPSTATSPEQKKNDKTKQIRIDKDIASEIIATFCF